MYYTYYLEIIPESIIDNGTRFPVCQNEIILDNSNYRYFIPIHIKDCSPGYTYTQYLNRFFY